MAQILCYHDRLYLHEEPRQVSKLGPTGASKAARAE